MIEFIQAAFGVLVVCGMAWMVWESSKMISERNEWRKRTGKYYYGIDDDESEDDLPKGK